MEEPQSRLIYLIKHALPQIDPGQPASRWRLSEEGRRRSQVLAERLSGASITALAASLEPKAGETARILSSHLGQLVESMPGLEEHHRETTGWLDTAAFQAGAERLFADPDALVFGEETANQALARFAHAVDDFISRRREGNLAIVTHGTVISLFAASRAGQDGWELWQRLGLLSYVALSLPRFGLHQVVYGVEPL